MENIQTVMKEIEKAEAQAAAILDDARKRVTEMTKKTDEEIQALRGRAMDTTIEDKKRHTGHDKTTKIEIDKKKQDEAVKYILDEFKKRY